MSRLVIRLLLIAVATAIGVAIAVADRRQDHLLLVFLVLAVFAAATTDHAIAIRRNRR